MLTDGRTTDAGVTGILIAHLGAFGSDELKIFIKCAQNEKVQKFKVPNKGLFVSMYGQSGPII